MVALGYDVEYSKILELWKQAVKQGGIKSLWTGKSKMWQINLLFKPYRKQFMAF